MSAGADFTVTNHGTIFLLQPHTQAAKDWLRAHVPTEQWQMFGEAVAVEHRYIAAIVVGFTDDGLTHD